MIFSRIADRLLEKRVAAYQDDLIEKHFEEVQSIYDKMRGWRHDYHNHIQALLALVGTTSAPATIFGSSIRI